MNTWKEIAAFLGRDERTAKRWEADRALPIRRVPGGRSTVFAYRRDLESWLANTPSDAPPPAVILPALTIAGAPRRSARFYAWLALGGLAVVVAAVSIVSLVRPHLHRSAPLPPAIYSSATYLMNTRTRAGLERAIDEFSTLILQRPRYAPAYAGLASSYMLMPEYVGMPPARAFAEAKVAAERAVQLDPDLAEGQRALGFAEFWGAHDPAKSRQAFDHAIRLDPGDANTRHWYGNVLVMLGDERGALRQFAAAERLDPASTNLRIDHASALLVFGRLTEADDLLSAVEAGQPTDGSALVLRSRLEMRRGDFPAALDAMSRAAALDADRDEAEVAEAGERGLASDGPAGMRAAILAERRALYARDGHSPYNLAVSAAPVDPSEAMRLLDALAAAGNPMVMAVGADWRLRPLHGDPRYAALLSRLRLPAV